MQEKNCNSFLFFRRYHNLDLRDPLASFLPPFEWSLLPSFLPCQGTNIKTPPSPSFSFLPCCCWQPSPSFQWSLFLPSPFQKRRRPLRWSRFIFKPFFLFLRSLSRHIIEAKGQAILESFSSVLRVFSPFVVQLNRESLPRKSGRVNWTTDWKRGLPPPSSSFQDLTWPSWLAS